MFFIPFLRVKGDSVMNKILVSGIIVFVSALLFSCGGGGGSSNSNQNPNTPPTKAIVKLATTIIGTIPSNTTINGYEVTLILPAGVTLKSTSAPPEPDSGVVTASGEAAGAYIVANYTAATSSSEGSVKLVVVSASAINAGEFTTITCDLAAGSSPSSADFTTTAFKASGLVTSPTASTVDLSTELAVSATATLQ